VASQALHVTRREAPLALHGFVENLRAIVPPVEGDRVLGPELNRLADDFSAHVFAAG
jgi:histidine ammonia-lyase